MSDNTDEKNAVDDVIDQVAEAIREAELKRVAHEIFTHELSPFERLMYGMNDSPDSEGETK